MADDDKVTLGSGTLYIDGVDVGHLKGNVEFVYGREHLDFKPAKETGVVKKFVISEHATLRASMAELKASNLKLALGLNEAVSSSQSFPGYEGGHSGTSYTADDSASFDVHKLGGKRTVDEVSIRFEHERDDGKEIVIVLYNAVAPPEITVPFNEEDVNLMDVTFEALIDDSRSAGDQMGFIAVQSAGS